MVTKSTEKSFVLSYFNGRPWNRLTFKYQQWAWWLGNEMWVVPFYSHILTWGVGFWPREFMTVPSSLVLMVPSPSLSNRAKASLNSAVCSSVRWSAITASGLKHIVLQTYNIPAFYEITYHQDISTATLVLCCTFCTGPRLKIVSQDFYIFVFYPDCVNSLIKWAFMPRLSRYGKWKWETLQKSMKLFLQMFLFTHATELGALLILLNLLKFISTSISL